jgi:hypothetical protein
LNTKRNIRWDALRSTSMFEKSPSTWERPSLKSEDSLHQIAPYIGKLKSTIASDLIKRYSNENDLIVDPFSGSGSVPLECALNNRSVFASDINPYSQILTKGKLSAPSSLELALEEAEGLLGEAKELPSSDLRKVPAWVRKFFHPKTLKEALNFVAVCKKSKNDFLLACILGILHHERPGFLSYPSSHLVPYLRDKKYPREHFPEMYEYRELRLRLLKKIVRVYKHKQNNGFKSKWEFIMSDVNSLEFPRRFNCLITSPPYMNNLDYVRDNRLRLWFISPNAIQQASTPVIKQKEAFQRAMISAFRKIDNNMEKSGHCIFIVGEKSKSEILSKFIFDSVCSHTSLKIVNVIEDSIPDIRRSRRNCKSTKKEFILVFKK